MTKCFRQSLSYRWNRHSMTNCCSKSCCLTKSCYPMIRSIPTVWRRQLVVAAAADYFFDKKWKSAISALSLNAVPIDRESTGRTSSDLLSDAAIVGA